MHAALENELNDHQQNVNAERVTLKDLMDNIKKVYFYVHPETSLTICILTLRNGFTVTGESACADPKMYSEEIGKRLAQEDATKKIWSLMGYALKEKLHLSNIPQEIPNFQNRVRNEAKELKEKIDKLDVFMKEDERFNKLPEDEQQILSNQRLFMENYYDILNVRISRFF